MKMLVLRSPHQHCFTSTQGIVVPTLIQIKRTLRRMFLYVSKRLAVCGCHVLSLRFRRNCFGLPVGRAAVLLHRVRSDRSAWIYSMSLLITI